MATVYEIITERILEQLEAGTVPWRKTWRTKGGFPRNLKSGKAYRGINVFLLSMLGYENPHFVTFKQAKEMGGSIKKGEQGSPVVFWKWPTQEEKEAEGKEAFPIVRYYKVWNIAQTEGITHKRLTEWQESQAEAEATEAEVIDGAEAIVKGWTQAPPISHNFQRAFYNPLTDRIGMPRAEAFESGPAYYCTLFHELGHSTGHSSRLDRKLDTNLAAFGSSDYSKEELVAEMTASFLCGSAGILDSQVDRSASYIDGWLKSLRNDRRLVVMAAALAQKAADYILCRDWSVTG